MSIPLQNCLPCLCLPTMLGAVRNVTSDLLKELPADIALYLGLWTIDPKCIDGFIKDLGKDAKLSIHSAIDTRRNVICGLGDSTHFIKAGKEGYVVEVGSNKHLYTYPVFKELLDCLKPDAIVVPAPSELSALPPVSFVRSSVSSEQFQRNIMYRSLAERKSAFHSALRADFKGKTLFELPVQDKDETEKLPIAYFAAAGGEPKAPEGLHLRFGRRGESISAFLDAINAETIAVTTIPMDLADAGIAILASSAGETANLMALDAFAQQVPIDTGCECYCCKTYTRGYVHHLLRCNEMLGPTLLTLHNITALHKLIRGRKT